MNFIAALIAVIIRPCIVSARTLVVLLLIGTIAIIPSLVLSPPAVVLTAVAVILRLRLSSIKIRPSLWLILWLLLLRTRLLGTVSALVLPASVLPDRICLLLLLLLLSLLKPRLLLRTRLFYTVSALVLTAILPCRITLRLLLSLLRNALKSRLLLPLLRLLPLFLSLRLSLLLALRLLALFLSLWLLALLLLRRSSASSSRRSTTVVTLVSLALGRNSNTRAQHTQNNCRNGKKTVFI